jgi:hypothetical protein
MNTSTLCLLSFAAAALVVPVSAQSEGRRATLTGGGSNDTGKCTIEIYLDGSADVEVRGDSGFLRTISGQPAQWRRFECSGPMPANPNDFRFSGVDGRGRQELVQDPRNGRGSAVVRIEDAKGGAEGYTFDLVWRGTGFGSSHVGQSLGATDRPASPNVASSECQDAVRDRAAQQYGLRDIEFISLIADDNPGSHDSIMGSFATRRGNDHSTYRFSCAVDLANGRVRGVAISPGPGALSADRYVSRDGATSACQLAAEKQITHDGYRNVQFGWPIANNRGNDWIAGTAKAQRGNNARAYDFDIRCSANLDNGSIRSMQVHRR